MKKCCIYGLIDPRQPLIRYVGKTTTNLSIRLNNHIYKARSLRNKTISGDWIRSLLQDNVRPEIILLTTCFNKGNESEREWISKLSNLLNICAGGNGAYTRSDFPSEYLHLLGAISDGRVAEQAGMSRENVSYHRRKLGIGKADDLSRMQPPPKTKNKFTFTQEIINMLGTVPDHEIASILGMTDKGVGYRRNKLGIKAYKK